MAFKKGHAKVGGRKPGAKTKKTLMLQTIAEINAQHIDKDGEGFNPYKELISVYNEVKNMSMVKTQTEILKEIMKYTYPQLRQIDQVPTNQDQHVININVKKS